VIDKRCIEVVRHRKIKVEENGKSAVVLNPKAEKFIRVQVDGCAQTDGIKADWAIERARAAVIVELKGGNVQHGADQVLSTARHWTACEKRCDRVAGLIVGRQSPQANATMQLKKQEFTRRYGGPLHVVGQNEEYQWGALFEFRNPLKK
jgi:hypothetical protein